MFIYENLKDLEDNGNLAVSPMAYVIFGCAR